MSKKLKAMYLASPPCGNFYCQIVNGSEDFSIEEWNATYKSLLKANVSEEKMNEILHPKPCTNQCFDCMAIVGERRKRTQELLSKKK